MISALHLENCGDLPPGQSVDTVWVPSETVICHRVQVPDVGPKKWREMIPWLLEDRLLETPDQMTFATGDRADDGSVSVACVRRQVIEQWRSELLGEGIEWRRLVPDFFALPWQPGQIACALQGERAVLRWGLDEGAAGTLNFMTQLLSRLMVGSDKQLLVYCDDESLPLPEPFSDAGVEKIRDLWTRVGDTNLALAQATGVQRPGRVPLSMKVATALALFVGGLWLAGQSLETSRMNAQADYLETQLGEGYRQYTGNVYDLPAADFRAVAGPRLTSGHGLDGPWSLIDHLADVVDACGKCPVTSLVASVDQAEITLAAGGGLSAVALPAGMEAEQERRGGGLHYRVWRAEE